MSDEELKKTMAARDAREAAWEALSNDEQNKQWDALYERVSADDRDFVSVAYSAVWKKYFATKETLEALVQRVEPVCRNCVHAGPPTLSAVSWSSSGRLGSCRKNAPQSGRHHAAIEHHIDGPEALWATVRDFDSCGDFTLKPLPEAMRKQIKSTQSGAPKWAFAEVYKRG